MNAVVFDLELVKRFKKGQLSEIVEIGACKIDLRSKKIVDTFQVYISPNSGYISKSTRKFINMPKEDLKRTVPFSIGIQKFVNFLGDDYYLCSWGKDDRLHIINQCVRNKLKLDWFKNYNDIQQQIGMVIQSNNKNQLGLKNALEISDIVPVGIAHRGIDDAINTGKLLIKYIDEIQLQCNEISNKDIKQYYIRLNEFKNKNRSNRVEKSSDN